MAFLWLSPAKRPKRRGRETAVFVGFILFVHRQRASASFPVVLGDFGCDVTRQACRENSKPPLVTRIARIGLGTRLREPVLISCLPKVDHVIKSCNSSLSLFALEDKETEKLDTNLSFVQHGVAHGA